MLGPQGSGKGTYSSRLSPILGIPQISSGDIMREEIAKESPLGIKVKEYMDKGILVPDDIVIQIIKDRLKKPDCEKGFIFDGFPRTLNQARELEKITKIDVVIYLDVPEWILLKRLGSRVSCEKCKEIYNLINIKPKREGICDKCGGRLIQREDETPEAIKKRLKEYEENTQPLIDYYKSKGILKTVKCYKFETPPEEKVEEIAAILRGLK